MFYAEIKNNHGDIEGMVEVMAGSASEVVELLGETNVNAVYDKSFRLMGSGRDLRISKLFVKQLKKRRDY